MDFVGISSQQQRLRSRIDARISRVLDHGKFIRGPEVVELEQRLATFAGARHCVSCANGTDALQIALMALGIGPGDRVIVPAFSFFATVEAVVLVGAVPVFVDIDPLTYNIDIHCLAAAISTEVRAIIAVSMFGQCAALDVIEGIASARGIAVIEDAAQSFGATLRGRHSCALSRVACTSFFPTKPLACYGDGGAIFTSDDELARKMACISQHGQSARYCHEMIGMNSRLDTLQAAILLEKLDILEDELAARDAVASWYADNLVSAAVQLPHVQPGNRSAWAQYTIALDSRDEAAARLAAQGVPTSIHYPKPLHRQPAVHCELSLPASETAARRVLSLPMHPYLSRDDVRMIARCLG